MPVDESDFLRPLARLIAWVLVDFVYEIGFQLFCVWVGRVVLLIMTLGKYPNSHQAEKDEVWIGIFGVAFVLVSAYIALEYLN